MKNILYTVVAIGMLGLVGWGVWHGLTPSLPPSPTAEDIFATPQDGIAGLAPVQPAPAGWLVYTNEALHFSVAYPPELKIKTYDEGGGAQTIVLQSTDPAEGFQIFAAPYEGTQISQERFKQDAPSGVRNNPQTTAVGGKVAVSFYGRDAVLGDTAEVWMIHKGYLYEVSTIKPLASWLTEIMATWRWL